MKSTDLEQVIEEIEAAFGEHITPVGLEAVATQIVRLRDAQARIAEEGAIILDAKGNAVPHPAIEIERRAGDEIRLWIVKYGQDL